MFLYVPFEDDERVRALGAHRDPERLCWYLEDGQDPAPFLPWLDDDPAAEEELFITSDSACVAMAATQCWLCSGFTEVVCIYCDSGTVLGEPLERFSVSHIWKVDDALALQLQEWPEFRVSSTGSFVNHCGCCGGVLDDMELHSEPDHPFFDIPAQPAGAVRLILLEGVVRLCGSEHFGV